MKSKVLAVLVAVVLVSGCFGPGDNTPGPDAVYDYTFFAMDTVVTVRFWAPITRQEADGIFAEIEAEIEALENILSAFIPGSDVDKIAAAAGVSPVAVSPATLAVIATSLEYGERTGGAFDITLAPVLELYDFVEKRKPTFAQLEQALALVNYRDVQVDGEAGTVFLAREGMKLDLGGIAKGYIVDWTADILQQRGIKVAAINAGGDIVVWGENPGNPDGNLWRIGIKDPDNPAAIFARVFMAEGAIVTSGDYERYFEQDGIRYHHIIDPATGLPADGVRSVTVIAPTAKLADLLSTAVFVMGAEAGLALIETLPDVEVLIWDAEGNITWSSGMEDMLSLEQR